MCCLDLDSEVAWLGFLGMVKCMPENLVAACILSFEQGARLLLMRLSSDDDGSRLGSERESPEEDA